MLGGLRLWVTTLPLSNALPYLKLACQNDRFSCLGLPNWCLIKTESASFGAFFPLWRAGACSTEFSLWQEILVEGTTGPGRHSTVQVSRRVLGSAPGRTELQSVGTELEQQLWWAWLCEMFFRLLSKGGNVILWPSLGRGAVGKCLFKIYLDLKKRDLKLDRVSLLF